MDIKITTSDSINQTHEQTNPQTGLHIGGTAILIHEELAQHITSIVRTNHRIMTVTLQSQKSHTQTSNANQYICTTQRAMKTRKMNNGGESNKPS